ITASGASGIASASFPAAPTGWTKRTGTNSATYTLGSASASSSLTGVSATNNTAGTTSENVTITLDVAPTVSLTFPTNGGLYAIRSEERRAGEACSSPITTPH